MSRTRRTRTDSKGAGCRTTDWQSDSSSRIRLFKSGCRPFPSKLCTELSQIVVSGMACRSFSSSCRFCNSNSRDSRGSRNCKVSDSGSWTFCRMTGRGRDYWWRSWHETCQTGRGTTCCGNNRIGSRCGSSTFRSHSRWHRSSSHSWTLSRTR